MTLKSLYENNPWEFPGGLVVSIWCFRFMGSIPGWGTEISQVTQHGQKINEMGGRKEEKKTNPIKK